MSIVRSPVRSVVRSPVRGVLGGGVTLAGQAKAYLNGITPYHWFDFINDRCLYASNDVGGVSGATGYSFSRASQGYYTNSDGTLTLFGHNLLLRSQEFDNASWETAGTSGTGVAPTRTANQGAAPDGTITADRVQFSLAGGTASGDISLLRQQVTVASGQTYTFSVYLKSNDSNSYAMEIQGAASTASAITVTPTWQRFTITTASVSTLDTPMVRLRGARTPTNSNTADILMWGAQYELGSTATTYVPTTSAAAGALRRGNRGVLIEGARTNLLLRSQEFDNASWTKTRTTATADAVAAPDGTLTAEALIEDTTAAASHEVSQSVTKAASAIAYTASVYVRPAGRDWLCFTLFDNSATGIRAWFNVTTGALGTTAAIGAGFTSVSHSIEALAGGWYRCFLTATSNTATAIRPIFYTSTADGSFSHTGDGASGIYLWGAQLEAASFPSSYITTVAASATRAADVLTCTAGVSYPLSLWAEFERAVDGGSVQRAMILHDGSTNNRAIIGFDSVDRIAGFTSSGGVTQADIAITGAVAVDTVTKAAMRVTTNSVQVCRDGVLGTEDTVATNPATPSTLAFAQNAIGAELFGYIRRAAIFSSALSDADLQSVTT